MRILHLTDTSTGRGGAYSHLAGIVDWQLERDHQVWVAAGAGRGPRRDLVLEAPGLESRTRAAFDGDRLLRALRPDLLHLHTVVNPAVLEWAGHHKALITVQDHRY